MVERRSKGEAEFRKSQRWLLILLALLFPVMLVASKVSDVLGTDLVVELSITALMAAFVFVSTWSFVAYCRWKGKYPFYWLRRK